MSDETEVPLENLEQTTTGDENSEFEELIEEEAGQITAQELEAVYDIPVQVSQLLKLGRGAVVELDRKVGEAIDIYVNNRLIARGEVVIVDERLGVTMTEIIKSDRPGN